MFQLANAIMRMSAGFMGSESFWKSWYPDADAAKIAFAVLKDVLAQNGGDVQKKDKVILATVKGDIHDIGKNIVKVLLENYSFDVIDLGKDVPREVIVKEAIEKKASLIMLSALMTTTMQEMKQVIIHAREKKCDAKIIIGGAVITEEYQHQIGADGYAKDAADTVRVIKTLLNLKD